MPDTAAHIHCYCGCTGCGVSRANAAARTAGCRCEGGCEREAEPGLPLCRSCRIDGCRPASTLTVKPSTSPDHKWQKHEPVTVGKRRPSGYARKCGEYRTQRPMPLRLGPVPVRPPFAYYGGKMTVADKIVGLLPDHEHCAERVPSDRDPVRLPLAAACSAVSVCCRWATSATVIGDLTMTTDQPRAVYLRSLLNDRP